MMEGGGQLLRNAIAYSAILDEPIQVINIRAKREPSGLKPQHLTTLKAAANICNAEISGLKLGSKDIKFFPGEISGGSYKFDIGTAGSISLLLQCLVPITTFANKKTELIIIGGTAVKWSPPIPFLEKIVYKFFKDMGMDIKIKLLRHGFYPKGGEK
jgi:RNA 3'-terminal phosphate cyclase (ATP)